MGRREPRVTGREGAAFSLRESVDLLGVPFPALVVAHPESFPWGLAPALPWWALECTSSTA